MGTAGKLFVALVLVLGGLLAHAQTRPKAPSADMLAAPERAGWSVDARTGCWVWNHVPQPDETVHWSAGCGPDGRATGRGVREWRYGGKTERYEGEYRDGKEHGRGVLVGSNGDRYEGEWRDGKQHGRGVYVWADGGRYDGEWRDGRPDGFGEGWISGNRYLGNWAGGCFRQGDSKAAFGRPVSECP